MVLYVLLKQLVVLSSLNSIREGGGCTQSVKGTDYGLTSVELWLS